MPTTGNVTLAGETEVSGGATLAGDLRRGAGENFFFMSLFPGVVSVTGCLSCQNREEWMAQFFRTKTRSLQGLGGLIELEFLFHRQRGDHVRWE